MALLVIHSGHIVNQIHHAVGIAALVIVPGDQLYEGIRQRDAGLGVENGGVGIAQKI